jgi:hypothetical protein
MRPDYELADIKSAELAKQYADEQTQMFEAKKTEIVQEGDTWTLRVWY